jgi:hypothetical protein
MFIRFRQKTAQRYGNGERECAGKCQNRPRYYARWGAGMIVKGRTFVEGCPMKPLCPLVQKRHRLEVSIVETCRDGGKVKQKHVASLGSIAGDSPAAREQFWLACEATLARLSNRLGPDLDRLRQAIAARIPPITDVDRAAVDAARWDSLEGMWDDHAKSKARQASKWMESVKQDRRAADVAETITLHAKSLRGNPKAYDVLNRLLGLTLASAVIGGSKAAGSEQQQQLKDDINNLFGANP